MYLKAKYAATERNVSSGDVALVAVPAVQRLAITPTNIGQLYSSSGQWPYPGIRMLMSLGNSKNVAACIVENLPWLSQQMQESLEGRLLGIKAWLETLRAEAGAQSFDPVARVRLFLDYAIREGIGGISYDIGSKVRIGKKLSSDEAGIVARQIYFHLKRTKGAASFVKDGIRDYITRGEADEKAMRFLATAVSPIFGKEADDSAANAREQATLESEAQQVISYQQQLTGFTQIMQNGNGQAAHPEGLEAVVRAASAIKAGNNKTSFETAAAIADGINFHLLTYQMIQLLTGAEPGQHFLCEVDGAAEKEAGRGILVPFTFKAANGTNVPEELRQYYLPTQDFASYMMVLDGAITNILLAYLHESRGEDTGTAVHVGMVRRALSPNNCTVQILYPEALIEMPGKPELAAEVAERALKRYKNGDIAVLAARHMGLTENELSQTNLETLISVIDQTAHILPFEVYQLASHNALLNTLAVQLMKAPQEELNEQYNRLSKKALKLRQTLQGKFGTDIDKAADYVPKVEPAIALFGEGKIGFIKPIMEWGHAE